MEMNVVLKFDYTVRFRLIYSDKQRNNPGIDSEMKSVLFA